MALNKTMSLSESQDKEKDKKENNFILLSQFDIFLFNDKYDWTLLILLI